jgi:hypothetical protein
MSKQQGNKTPVWKQEHPKANVPALIADHAELTDVSWHNDACPSFTRKGWDKGELDIRLWVDYEDKMLSDFADLKREAYRRFFVTRHDWNDLNQDQETLYHGDDANEAIRVLLEATK